MSQDDVLGRIDKLEKWAIDMLIKIDQVRESMLIYCDGQDAVNTQLRRSIGGNPFKNPTLEQKLSKPIEVKLPNLNNLVWTVVPEHDYDWQGEHKHVEAYEKSEDKAKPEFVEQLKLIESKGERTMFNGGFIVWLDKKNGNLCRRARK